MDGRARAESAGSAPDRGNPLRKAVSEGATAATPKFAREAVLSRKCKTFAACKSYLASLGLPEDALDATHDICWCIEGGCAARHPNTVPRGARKYGANKVLVRPAPAVQHNIARHNVISHSVRR